MATFPDTSPPDERLLRLIHRTGSAGRVLRRLLADHVAACDLNDAEFLVIWLCVGHAGGWVQVELAAAVGLSPAQTSGIVERLRQRGLIDMQRSATDRRRQVWRATSAGTGVVERLRPELARLAQAVEEQVPAATQHTFCEVCDQLAAKAIELDQQPGASSRTGAAA